LLAAGATGGVAPGAGAHVAQQAAQVLQQRALARVLRLARLERLAAARAARQPPGPPAARIRAPHVSLHTQPQLQTPHRSRLVTAAADKGGPAA